MSPPEWMGLAATQTKGTSGLRAAIANWLTKNATNIRLFGLNEDKARAHQRDTSSLCIRVEVSDPTSIEKGMSAVQSKFGMQLLLRGCAGVGAAAKAESPWVRRFGSAFRFGAWEEDADIVSQTETQCKTAKLIGSTAQF